jgi:hypothetical protein
MKLLIKVLGGFSVNGFMLFRRRITFIGIWYKPSSSCPPIRRWHIGVEHQT